MRGHVLHFVGYLAYRLKPSDKTKRYLDMARGITDWLRHGMWKGQPYDLPAPTSIVMTSRRGIVLEVKEKP